MPGSRLRRRPPHDAVADGGLPALTTIREEEEGGLGPVSHQELIEPPEFRAASAAVHSVRVNVTLGTMDFAEFAAAASAESDRVLRSI
ncbi:DUF6924 domain-containing protein [Streptomyces cinereoruber]|uniref:DUF6924 domain-containing protein n=1 Tax=Streptomyces cinereoruber TaxID=67260 RepID=UPI003643C8F4